MLVFKYRKVCVPLCGCIETLTNVDPEGRPKPKIAEPCVQVATGENKGDLESCV